MARSKPSDTLVNDLAQRIRKRIQSERLADGSLFMTEAQLAEEYGVSRTVAREAMSRLRALGIVEGRQRKGLVVRRPDPLRLLSDSLPSFVDSQEDLRELAQLRYALELGAVELAIRNATDEQIEQLGQTLAEMEQALRSHADLEHQKGLDLKFHVLILQMTGSRMIAGMQQVLAQFFKSVVVRELDEPSIERVIWEHRELYQACKDRDLERARSMMRVQFGDWWVTRPELKP